MEGPYTILSFSVTFSEVAVESQSALNQVLDRWIIAFVQRGLANIPVNAHITQLSRIWVNRDETSLNCSGWTDAVLGSLFADHHRVWARSFCAAHDREQAAWVCLPQLSGSETSAWLFVHHSRVTARVQSAHWGICPKESLVRSAASLSCAIKRS